MSKKSLARVELDMNESNLLVEHLLEQEHSTLYSAVMDGLLLEVKETQRFRWFTYGGDTPQSIMDRSAPDALTTLVSHAMLLFVLFDRQSKHVLNLGLGGGTFERALAEHSAFKMTSIESSQAVIDIAKRFFSMHSGSAPICQNANQFVQSTQEVFDVVLCDLFVEERLPDFLSSEPFYAEVKRITRDDAVLVLNLQADSEAELLEILVAIRQRFSYIALFEFDNYKNVIAVCSASELPDKHVLNERLAGYAQIDFSCLSDAVQSAIYIRP